MISSHLLFDGPENAKKVICLAHGAGAPMDSIFMNFMAEGLAKYGFRVVRFEFPYMAERRLTGKKKPPDRPGVLLDAWRTKISQLGSPSRILIGGKSLGGRIASMIADEIGVAGLICLGYPFHPPGKPPSPERLAHLETLTTPTLICQGTRDPFGKSEDIKSYSLSSKIQLHWIDDGNHNFTPRKKSGRTEVENFNQALNAILKFSNEI